MPPGVVSVQSGKGTEVPPTTSESASFNSVRDKEVIARQNEMTAAHAYMSVSYVYTHLLGPSNTYMRCRLVGFHNFMRVLITSRTLGLLVRQGYKNWLTLALKFQITGRAFKSPASAVGAMAEEQKANKVHLTLHTVSGNVKDKWTLVQDLIMCAHAADIWGLEQAIQA